MYVRARIGFLARKHISEHSGMKGEGILLEKAIERSLVCEVKKRGGMALKFISPGLAGVPDRLVVLPKEKLAFVELKAPGKTMRPLQLRRADQLRQLGFLVYCIDQKDKIGGMLDEIQAT